MRAAVTAAPGHPAISRPPAARHATFPQVGRRARSARSLAAQGALLPRLTTSGPRRLGSRSPRRSLGAVAAGLAAQGLRLGAEQQPPAGPSRASCHRAAPGTQEAPPLPRGSAASCQNSIWWGIFFFFYINHSVSHRCLATSVLNFPASPYDSSFSSLGWWIVQSLDLGYCKTLFTVLGVVIVGMGNWILSGFLIYGRKSFHCVIQALHFPLRTSSIDELRHL